MTDKLGDAIGKALGAVGITDERVSRWLGRPCGCRERRERLNALGQWAARVLSGKTDDAAEQLGKILAETAGEGGPAVTPGSGSAPAP